MENDDTIFSDMHLDETEVSLIQGFLTRLIDFAVDIVILFLLYKFIPHDIIANLINGRSFMLFIIVITVAAAYQFVFLLLFNKTIGMMICQVKYLNKELKPLSAREKVLSIFRTRFSKIKYYLDK
jgi:uncharacterized RDD family membrane protein YckC